MGFAKILLYDSIDHQDLLRGQNKLSNNILIL
jgi:hypothetical protein